MKMKPAKRRPVADILICTPDIRSPLFEQCLNSLLRTTKKACYNLIVLDNRRSSDFKHSEEMKKAYRMSKLPLITLDDDVILEDDDWFEKMLDASCIPNTGIVVTTTYRHNKLWATGQHFSRNGYVINWRNPITKPTPVIFNSSCCCLFQKINSGELETNPVYQKYYFDPDLSLHYWSRDIKTISVPARVTHIGGGQMKDTTERMKVFDEDREYFKRVWIDSGKYDDIVQTHWSKWHPDLQNQLKERK